MSAILSKGQALSTWKFSGSANSFQIFEDNNHGTHTVKVQGFVWNGSQDITIADSNGIVLYDGSATSPSVWPPTASGSYGLVCTIPFTCTANVLAGGGGTLIVYGEVM